MRAPFVVVVGLIGCSEASPTDLPATDSSVSSSYPDVISSENPPCLFSPCDTTPPHKDLTCDAPIPADFACAAPTPVKGAIVCTDVMLEALMACFPPGDSAKCAAARVKFPECDRCVLRDWIYGERWINVGACMQALDPESECGQAWRCDVDCINAACGECADAPGSGKTSTTSELDDCAARARSSEGGACYERASRDLALCRLNTKVLPCFVDRPEDVLRFYRGACRDGGDWSKASG